MENGGHSEWILQIYSTLGEEITLVNWMVKFAHPFLANFIVKQKTGDYANGEFKHFSGGIVQGYEQLFKLNGIKNVVEKLKTICCVLHLGRNDKCFCGSGKKFKKCYLVSPFSHKYSGIPYDLLSKDLVEILTFKHR